MTVSTLTPISPTEVHGILARYMLADGFDLVFDFEKSHGAWVHDSRTGREYLDFCTFFASNPIGYNHPKMKDPEFLKVLHRVAQLKPALADLYTVEYAWFVDVFGRLAMPAHMRYAFFIEGGTLGVENALKTAFDWKVRRNRAKGIAGVKGQQVLHFRQAFHGRSGYALSLTNTDPVKTDLFPKFPWPRVSNPGLRFPVTPEVERDVVAAEQRSLDEIEQGFRRQPRRHRGHPDRAHPGRGRRHPLPPGVPAGAPGQGPPARGLLRPRRGADGRRHHREDVGPRALRPGAGRGGVRQEDAGLRLHGGAEGGRGARERVQGLLADQLDLGRRPHRHGPRRAATSRSSTRTGSSRTRGWPATGFSTACAPSSRSWAA